MEYAIIAHDLSKTYGRRIVVDHVTFTVPAGQTLGLLGPNGAGKTTTMRMLMGLSRPTSGAAQIFGLDIKAQLKQIHRNIGVVFEKPNLFEALSGYQNLKIFCRLYGQPETKIRPFLERMDLWERAHDPVKTYSKGMRQRILISRALIHEPKLLFLDEPCSGLDPVSSRIIRDYLLELKKRGITILLTSHDMEEVDELCDQIGFINHGRMIALEEPYLLKEKYGTQQLRLLYRTTSAPDSPTRAETLAPTPANLQKINLLYLEKRIISLHSTEATLGEIFRKLSETTIDN